MVLKQEELISRYFEHGMSPAEEQNFLISLAASDDLRIAFRSHLELMKAVRDDKDDLRSVAQVRTRTLAALGISAAAVTPFIEQELMKSTKPTEEVASAPSVESTPQAAGSSPWLSRLGGLLRSRKFALGTGLALGFSTATVLLNVPTHTDDRATHSAAQPAAVTQQAQPPLTAPNEPLAPSVRTEAAPDEALSAKQPEGPSGTSAKVSRNETITSRTGLHNEAVSHDTKHVSTHLPAAAPSSSLATEKPVVNSSRPGKITAKPVTITPNDSGKAQ